MGTLGRWHFMRTALSCLFVTTLLLASGASFGAQKANSSEVPENLYRGELVTYPGPWAFQIPHSTIILTRDDELETLATDPDKAINMSTVHTPRYESLRQVCER